MKNVLQKKKKSNNTKIKFRNFNAPIPHDKAAAHKSVVVVVLLPSRI